jgi:hypothetical protein
VDCVSGFFLSNRLAARAEVITNVLCADGTFGIRGNENMSFERRRAPRYRLITTAEVSAEGSNATVKAKTSDVSLVGCFMNTPQSFPQGTKVKLKLQWNERSFNSTGVVARLQPMGMGISFENMKKDQTDTLRQWLSEISKGTQN